MEPLTALAGDSLCDLAYACLPYHLPRDLPTLRGFIGADIDNSGIPVRAHVDVHVWVCVCVCVI